MARLADMTLEYLENLLITNPGVTLFTGVFFTDIPANSDAGNIFPATSQSYGNPSRNQVKNAFQSKADQAKYLAGAQFPVVYSDPSTASLTGQLVNNVDVSNGASSAQTGLPNQTPTNATAPSGTTEALIPAIGAQSDMLVPAGVLKQPPADVQRIRLTADVINSN